MEVINGYTRTCGLIGDPVEHTLSPLIHNTLAAHTGQNLVYVPLHVYGAEEKTSLEDAVKGAYALNLLGLNVTVPYKSDVIHTLLDIDPLAEQIGAVNTLVRQDGGYKGYNTDMPGLYRAMCSDGVKIEQEKVLILGAGGVARAVAMLLVRKGASRIIILNRTVERAEQIAEEVNAFCEERRVCALALEEYRTLSEEEKYLAIQATNVGMFPRTQEAVIEDADFYKRIHTGYDLIFNPADTYFMQLVKKQGGRAYNGLKMLLYQGIIAYELWTGLEISQELAELVHKKMLEEMGI